MPPKQKALEPPAVLEARSKSKQLWGVYVEFKRQKYLYFNVRSLQNANECIGTYRDWEAVPDKEQRRKRQEERGRALEPSGPPSSETDAAGADATADAAAAAPSGQSKGWMDGND